MRNYKIIFSAGLVAFMLVFMAGCYYDKVLPEPVDNTSGEVSFSADIIPVFTQTCAISGCHNGTDHPMDLSAAVAFNTIMDEGLVNTAVPESSELYEWLTGKGALPMPPSGIDAALAAKVLAWIQQGAKNN